MNKLELEYGALKLLEQQPDMTQRQIAEELNVSLGKTYLRKLLNNSNTNLMQGYSAL
jgi:putative heme iron utilization protein